MFETLMCKGGYRVDYFMVQRNLETFGFYVRGEIRPGERCAHDAKQRLFAGLLIIDRCLGSKNLAGIYLDVDLPGHAPRLALAQLKKDLLESKFSCIFIYDLEDLFSEPCEIVEMISLRKQLGDLRIITAADLEYRVAGYSARSLLDVNNTCLPVKNADVMA
jgi:hypothetical protein